ncbi:MAG: DUF2147 domain-containing protein [Gemmatimonadales bacterium]
MNQRSWRVMATALALILVAGPVSAQAAAKGADAILGTWWTEDSASKVKIVDSAGTYSAVVTWVPNNAEGKPPVDVKNSDSALRTRPILGITILSGFAYGGNGVWNKGKIYAPKKGKSFSGQLTLGADGTLQVKAKSGPASKTVTWVRD